MPPSKAPERLRRLLTLVPYVVQHPGAEFGELTRLFGVSEDELVADLNLLFVSGLPPYGPGDLIDVMIEDGRVWIGMAEYLSRPLRLTRTEAAALYVRGKALMAVEDLLEASALSGALRKLEVGLGPETLGDLAGKVEYAGEPGGAGLVEQLRRAAATFERIELEYYSASRDEIGTRTVDPEEVFAAIGHWYVVAWDEEAGGERLFRTDRIRALKPTGEHFEARGLPGAGRALYEPSGDDILVRLRLRPEARWVSEYYVIESSIELENGLLEITIPARSLAWVAKLALRLGESAEILAPLPELAERVRGLARATLERYS